MTDQPVVPEFFRLVSESFTEEAPSTTSSPDDEYKTVKSAKLHHRKASA
jgi:hypothetical protein